MGRAIELLRVGYAASGDRISTAYLSETGLADAVPLWQKIHSRRGLHTPDSSAMTYFFTARVPNRKCDLSEACGRSIEKCARRKCVMRWQRVESVDIFGVHSSSERKVSSQRPLNPDLEKTYGL